MSREKKEDSLPVRIQEKLFSLRKKLEQNEDWPETADRLLADLNHPAQSSSVAEADYQMLSLVVNDALEGIDVTVQYPNFYRKLLANAELSQAFLDALAVLSGEDADELNLLPQELSQDLSFLQTAVSPPPTIQQTLSGLFQAAWELLAEQLNQKFFLPPEPAPVFRSSSLLEDTSIVLLRDDIVVGDRQYDVILEAVSPLDKPEQLQLNMLVTPLADGPLPTMKASLQWGSVELTSVPDRYGRAQFPLLPLHTILDESGHHILSDLHLSLEIG
jgi:hypothetical protein